METQKEMLIEAYVKKIQAFIDAYMVYPKDNEANQQLIATVKEIKKWVDIEDIKYVYIYSRYLKTIGYPALALKFITKHISNIQAGDANEKKIVDVRAAILVELGWSHWYGYFHRAKIVDFP